jgi:hypothetical protein
MTAARTTFGPCFRVALIRRRLCAGGSLVHKSKAVSASPTGPARRVRWRNGAMGTFFLIPLSQVLVSLRTESLRGRG